MYQFSFRKLFCVSLFALTACSATPGNLSVSPEHLLNDASELVSFSITNDGSIHHIATWVKDDMPNHAKLSCPSSSHFCQEVIQILNANHITHEEIFENEDKVTLVYDRITARNCPPNHFGCSVSVNAIQMTPNLNQFVRPGLLSPQDAATAVDKYNLYRSGL